MLRTEAGESAEFTRNIGDAWLAGRKTALARVPSAIVPRTWNYLLNPEHPEACQLPAAEAIKERLDNGCSVPARAEGIGLPSGFAGLENGAGQRIRGNLSLDT